MMTRAPRVSVGLPVFNGEQFIEEALNSLLLQTFDDFELIISDNASTDKTQQICRMYAAQDQRIRYYRSEHNLGAAWNYNRVFELAVGEYFKWAAHDDICAPEYLNRCVAVLDREPRVVLCYPRTTIINEHSKRIEDYVDGLNLRSPKPHERYAQYHNRYRAPGECNAVFGLIRADALSTTPLIGNYVSSDQILLGELALRGEICEIPEHLFFRRDHPQTSVRANRPRKARAVWFDPAAKGKIQMARWRWLSEYLSSIRRVRMSWQEKTRCYFQVGKWAVWNRKKLIKELITAFKFLLLSLPGPIKRSIRSTVRFSRMCANAIGRVLQGNHKRSS